MRILGRTERRVVSAILITALIPLVASILIARAVIQRVSAAAFQPEFSAHLHRSLGVYRDLAASIKQTMRFEAEAIASSASLRRASERRDEAAIAAELEAAVKGHPTLVAIEVERCDGDPIAKRDRGSPVDPSKERTLTVRRAVGGGEADEGCEREGDPAPGRLIATFATPRERFDELEAVQEFAAAYDEFARDHREQYLDRTYRNVFAVLLGFTIVLAVVAGILVVRPVTNRIARLAAATRPVAEGDLTVRVEAEGKDEVADLGRAFNRMLEELDKSRARIEFLRRIGEWQKMARRLAHEIKNPLTPIQLAVEECHRRYSGSDPEYMRILETTNEVVAEEVGSLRRLVSEFASFARLPRAELAPADLGEFLREQQAHFTAVDIDVEVESGADGSIEGAASPGRPRVELSFEIPERPMPVLLDREMMHRALTNIVRNAAQAIRDARAGSALNEPGASEDVEDVEHAEHAENEGAKGEASGQGRVPGRGRVHISAAIVGGSYRINVDDDGPGIDPELRVTIFDPYVTSKRDGTGLGLSIVKKIIVDHGGSIDARPSPLGGARFSIQLPGAETLEARAALEQG
jgi:nitrogen fixation/metabolism regulation signal transduction histidine kinase